MLRYCRHCASDLLGTGGCWRVVCVWSMIRWLSCMTACCRIYWWLASDKCCRLTNWIPHNRIAFWEDDLSYFAATTAGFSRTSSEELVFRNLKIILEMREFFRKNSTIINLGYFMRFCYLVLISFFLNSPAYAENLLNPDECALQIASRASFAAAQRVLKNYHFTKKNAVIYKAQNGYYAVSVGTLRPSEVSSVMNKWKANGRIPSDSRCSKWSGFLYALNPVTGQKMKRTTTQIAAKKPARVASKRVYIDCKRIDLRKEVAACYALTVGPKVCTQAINESSLKSEKFLYR